MEILAKVNPFDEPKELIDKSLYDWVVYVLEDDGFGILPVSLNDCVVNVLTWKAVAPPLVKSPKVNNSLSADELTVPVPV